jgi:lysophospholipase L1-like esterase
MAIRRVMCFGDSNTWGFVPSPAPPSTRFPTAERWPHVMRAALGADVEVIEEGLSGRTTDMQDPELAQVGGAGMDGVAYLPAALCSHLPLDAVVIMLGTNDLKAGYARTPQRIAIGAKRLLDCVRTLDGGVGTTYPNPRALLICPPPLGKLSPEFQPMFAGGLEKSRLLPPLYEAVVARAAGAAFLDAGTAMSTDGEDGVHFSAEMQRRLGEAAAKAVRPVLGL